MISQTTIYAMVGMVAFSLVLFIGAILFTKKYVGIAWKPLLIGSIGFIIFTQVLEKVLHLVVVTQFPNYAEHPWLFGLYGGLAAGTFEELGRYILFIWLLKQYYSYQGGFSFGVGWGGIEAVVLAATTVVPMILFAYMINAGTFDSEVAASLPAEQVKLIKDQLIHQQAFHYLWGIPERFFALFLQIALTLLVLLGVIQKKFSFVIYAILIHAAIDFPIVFFQTGQVTALWKIELYIAIIGIVSIIFIRKVKSNPSFQ